MPDAARPPAALPLTTPTISPSHHLTICTRAPHHLTISPSHHLTISPSHHLRTRAPHHLTISPSARARLTISPSDHLHARASPSPKYTPRQTLNVTELEVTHGGGLRWRVKLRSVRPEKINEGSGAGHTYHIGFGVSVNLKMSFWCTTLREGRTRFFFTFVEGLIITLHSNPPKIARNNLHTTYRRDTHGH